MNEAPTAWENVPEIPLADTTLLWVALAIEKPELFLAYHPDFLLRYSTITTLADFTWDAAARDDVSGGEERWNIDI